MAVSFAATAKAEICRVIPAKRCCARAMCFGILLYGNSFVADSIRIVTENKEFAQLLPKLFKKAFSVNFDLFPEAEASGKLIFQITDPDKISRIMSAYGFSPADTLSLNVNLAVVEEECCKTAFLRGAFLSGGSVTDPTKGYHIELTTTHNAVARQTYALMEEILGFYPKTAVRGATQMLYLKQSDQISDLLTFLGAPIAAMGIIEARLEKELNNNVNRRCNCDDGNTSKVVEAAQEQLAAIRILRKRGIVKQLPQKLQQALVAREKNPEASLTELAAMMDPPISKPAMNNRLKRLVALSKEATL